MNQLLKGIKNIFIVLILLNIAPALIVGIKNQYFAFLSPQTRVGELSFHSMVDSSERYSGHLRAFFEDPEIKAILLKIESPGGIPGSCQALFQEINLLKKKFPKPIITLTENMCTSGVYYIACATDCIIASPACLVGSIGSRFTTFFNTQKLLQQYNIEPHTIAAGKYKTAMSPFVPATPEQTAMLQGLANDTYEQFAHDVALTRKLSFAQKEVWADGKIFTGQQALKLGLVDAVGSYSTALEKIHALAPIEGEILWVKPQEDNKWFGWADTLKRSAHGIVESSIMKIMLSLNS
jgi:protease IV